MPIIDIDIDIKCKACNGTGLYVGMAERDGAAVVCYQCSGTGCYHFHFKYEPFTDRKARDDVKRVFKSSFGFVHSAEDVNDIAFSEGGVTYEEWLNGKPPKPLKKLYCPLSWTGQCWKPTWCHDFCGVGCPIPSCSKRKDGSMHECWEAYEKHLLETLRVKHE